MTATTLRRTGALLVSAALLASLTVATVAAPASAAKPKCAGKTATIVGTAKGGVIKGTKKADVIVAKGGNDVVYGRGGNDTICGGGGNDRILGAGGKDVLLGQGGRDKLYGGAARDRLLGGPANDRLAGGPGNDACLQGSGVGLRVGCERPVLAPVPVPVPPPPPADSDGDGVTDDVDACPNKGDQGYGVDGTGCPHPPPSPEQLYQSTCEAGGGTYSEGTDGNTWMLDCVTPGLTDPQVNALVENLEPHCDAAGGSLFLYTLTRTVSCQGLIT